MLIRAVRIRSKHKKSVILSKYKFGFSSKWSYSPLFEHNGRNHTRTAIEINIGYGLSIAISEYLVENWLSLLAALEHRIREQERLPREPCSLATVRTSLICFRRSPSKLRGSGGVCIVTEPRENTPEEA